VPLVADEKVGVEPIAMKGSLAKVFFKYSFYLTVMELFLCCAVLGIRDIWYGYGFGSADPNL
jgi:hypothetical protein